MQKKVIEGSKTTVTDYLDGYQYVNDTLQFYPHAEGYVKVNENNTLNYVYNYTDHLGNVRVSYVNDNGTAKIVEESNYYPFGLKHKGYNNQSNQLTDKYKYGYNGKEEQDELGLNWNDYGARNYDPALGRWMNHDPLAEMSRKFSPYAYALDNPVYFIDPDGMLAAPSWKNNGDGTYTAEAGDSAATLAQDAGVSYDEANALVQEQHGANYTENGVEKSNIGEGDVVSIPSQQREIAEVGVELESAGVVEVESVNSENVTKGEALLIALGHDDFASDVNYATEELGAKNIVEAGFYALWREKSKSGGIIWDGTDALTNTVGTTKSVLQKNKRKLNNVRSTKTGSTKKLTTSNSSSTTSKNPWNAYLKANKGKYNGKGWIKRAAKDYRAQKK